MKKYQTPTENEQISAKQQKRDELVLFQHLLRNSKVLDLEFHGKAREIADGLQPWIDALELALNR